MTTKLTLTAARVGSLPCESGKQQTIHWDAKTPGFGLRVTAAGARAYVFESRLFGKTLTDTRLGIGLLKHSSPPASTSAWPQLFQPMPSQMTHS